MHAGASCVRARMPLQAHTGQAARFRLSRFVAPDARKHNEEGHRMSMQEGNVLLIANPAAQRGNGETAAHIAYDLLAEWLGDAAVELAMTKHPGHATELATAAGGRFASVIALGGDGVIHETVNGLMKVDSLTRPQLGVIPVGSGNDYARTLGMSECVPDAIVQFLNSPAKQLDIGMCNGEYFNETLSFGLDAAIALDTVKRRERTGQQGTMLYLSSGIDQLLHHLDTYTLSATLDGKRTIEAPVLLITIQIGPTYGGGFRICPEADPADGMFDICYAAAPMSVFEATFKFLRAKDAHHVNYKKIFFEQASRLHLEFDRRPPCQIDGEAHLADAYDVELIPHALAVFAPALA